MGSLMRFSIPSLSYNVISGGKFYPLLSRGVTCHEPQHLRKAGRVCMGNSSSMYLYRMETKLMWIWVRESMMKKVYVPMWLQRHELTSTNTCVQVPWAWELFLLNQATMMIARVVITMLVFCWNCWESRSVVRCVDSCLWFHFGQWTGLCRMEWWYVDLHLSLYPSLSLYILVCMYCTHLLHREPCSCVSMVHMRTGILYLRALMYHESVTTHTHEQMVPFL